MKLYLVLIILSSFFSFSFQNKAFKEQRIYANIEGAVGTSFLFNKNGTYFFNMIGSSIPIISYGKYRIKKNGKIFIQSILKTNKLDFYVKEIDSQKDSFIILNALDTNKNENWGNTILVNQKHKVNYNIFDQLWHGIHKIKSLKQIKTIQIKYHHTQTLSKKYKVFSTQKTLFKIYVYNVNFLSYQEIKKSNLTLSDQLLKWKGKEFIRTEVSPETIQYFFWSDPKWISELPEVEKIELLRKST
jgi:hypothetical protein